GNIKKAAQTQAQRQELNNMNKYTIRQGMCEKGQFAVTWHKASGSNSTLFDFQTSLHNRFKTGKLPENGNSASGFQLAYEVSNDLFKGMNRLSAEVDGVIQKGSGRSTADLFYFNQSRS